MKLLELPIYYKSKESLRKFRQPFGYEYNQIVGWIAIEPRQFALRAEHWVVFQRPSRVLVFKQFEYKGKLFQISTKRLQSAQIFARLHSALIDTQENSYLSKYCIDLGMFNAIGPFVDWTKCIRLSRTNFHLN